MVRPRKTKIINFEPNVTYFKPRAVPLSQLEEVEITLDELETLRLSNIEKLNQTTAAKKMEIHQSTFHRTLNRANEKITDALINGKAIKIQGGQYKMPRGEGIRLVGRMGDFAAGPSGFCECPKCGYKQEHKRGVPCTSINCTKCNTKMVRN